MTSSSAIRKPGDSFHAAETSRERRANIQTSKSPRDMPTGTQPTRITRPTMARLWPQLPLSSQVRNCSLHRSQTLPPCRRRRDHRRETRRSPVKILVRVSGTATSHTYKLLIEAYATLEEPDLEGAERILAQMDCLDRYSDRGSPPFGPHPCEGPVC
jgi:hypothetical protein